MSGVTGVLLSYGSAAYVPPTPEGGWDYVLLNVDTILVTATWDWDGGTRLDPQLTGPFNTFSFVGSTTGYGGVSSTFNLTLPANAGQGAYENVDWGSSATVWRSGNAVAYEGGPAVSIFTGANFSNVALYANFVVDFPFTNYYYTGQDGCSIELKTYAGGVIQRSSLGAETLISAGGVLQNTLSISGAQTSDINGVILYARLQAVYVKASKTLYLKRIEYPYAEVVNTPDIEITGSRLGTVQFSRPITGADYIQASITNTPYVVDGLDTENYHYPGGDQSYFLPYSSPKDPFVYNTVYGLFYDIVLGWGTCAQNNYVGTGAPVVWNGPKQLMINFQKVLDDYPDFTYITTDNYYEDLKSSDGDFTVSGTMYNCSYLRQAETTVTFYDPPPPYIYKFSGLLDPVGGSAISSQTSGTISAGAYGTISSIFFPYTNTWKIFLGIGANEDGIKPIWTYPNIKPYATLVTPPVSNFFVQEGANTIYNVCWYKVFFPAQVSGFYEVLINADVSASSPNPASGVNDAKVFVVASIYSPASTTQTKTITVYPLSFGPGKTVYIGVARGDVFSANEGYDGWMWSNSSVNIASTYLNLTATILP